MLILQIQKRSNTVTLLKLTELETAELGQETMPSKGQNVELNLQASDFRLLLQAEVNRAVPE